MKRFRRRERLILFSLALAALVSLGLGMSDRATPRSARAQESPPPAKVVQRAWRTAQASGTYHFTTQIAQTTHPAPALVNVGRSSRREELYLKGRTGPPAGPTPDGHAGISEAQDGFHLTVWKDGGSILNPADGLEIRIEDDQAYGRQGVGPWQEIDDFSGVFAPGRDVMGYLAGATNIREIGREEPALPDGVQGSGLTQYAFDVDGPDFASFLRDQLEEYYRQRGELPMGLSLESPHEYEAVSGEGTIWVDERDLPRRLSVHLVYPPRRDGQRIEAEITTDFSRFAAPQVASGEPFQDEPLEWLASTLGLAQGWDGWMSAGQRALLAMASMGLLGSVVLYRRSRYVYTVVALAMILAMVLGPALQGHHVQAFSQRLTDERAEQESREEVNEAARQQRESFLSTDWDPHQDPLVGTSDRASGSEEPGQVLVSEEARDLSVSVEDVGALTTHHDEAALGMAAFQSRSPAYQLLAAEEEDEFDPAGDDDGDGLSNLAERRLGTDPRDDDTDGDGITDDAEVRGFEGADGQMYYLDPLSPDTNGDGLTDGMECPQLVRAGTNVLSPHATCQNTDGEAEASKDFPRVPDAFDNDNDNDGVPDKVDLSPFSALGSEQSPFGRTKPLALTLEDAQSGVPLLVDLQIRPKNPDHLAYALNVLDWPTGDNDGQIERVLDTTFGTHMTTEQLGQDPSASNGEMRLVPMVEVHLSGNQVPFKLTRPRTTLEVRGDISATVKLEQDASQSSKTALEWTLENSGSYDVGIFDGPCPVSPSTTSSDYSCSTDNSQSCTIDGQLTDLADGEHHLVLMEDADKWACTSIGNVVNGPYDDRMIDQEPLDMYGISVREKDDSGGLLAYAPVSVVHDELGARNVAFAARLAYQVGSGASAGGWGNAQEVRLVWLVQMLTDVCDAEGLADDATEDEVEAWCSEPDHRVEQTQFVHTYDEEWYATGMAVREDHGLDVAIAYEAPENDNHPDSDDHLWMLANGLEGSFVSGRTGSSGERDLTVPRIKQTFDITSTAAVSPTRWNIPLDALRVESYGPSEFPQQAHLAKTSGYAEDILEDHFLAGGEPTAAAPTLLIAREEHYRSTNLDEGTAGGGGGSASFSLGGAQMETVAAFQWRPYRYRHGAWEAYPIQEYMDLLSVRLGDRFQEIPDLYDPDYPDPDYARLALDTEILAWQSLYLSFYEGLANLVQAGPEAYELTDVAVSNSELADMAGSWTVKGIGFGDLAVQLAMVEDMLDHLASRLSEQADEADRLIPSWLFEEAAEIGEELNQGMMSKLKGRLSSLKLRDVWGVVGKGVDLTLAAAAVLTMAMSLSGSREWEIAMYVVGVVGAAWSLGQAIYNLAVRGTKEAAESTIKIFGATMSTAKVAGVIGLIIGAVMAFGFFIYAVASAGAEFFGLAFNALLAQTVAQVIVAVIMFAIAMIPIVGQLIAAIIAAIDALIYLICGVMGEAAQENVVGQWLCKGISGLATDIIKATIYDAHDLVDMQLENRVQTFNFEWTFASGSARKGTSVGSELDVSLGVTSTIQLNHVFPTWEEMLEGWKEGTTLIPIDWKSLAYAWQFNNDKLRSATFEYRLQTTDTDFHEQVSRDTMWSEWESNESDFGKYELVPFFAVKEAQTGSDPATLNEAGINREADLFLSEGYNVPIQECWAVPSGPQCAVLPYAPFVCWVPVCYIRDNDASNHIDMGQGFVLDVFPAALDGFYEAVEKDGGYSLAWGQSTAVTSTILGGAPLVFPRQLDFDGDGLLNRADGGTDPDDSNWDTDGDELSDLFELQTGSDPTNPDSDGDDLTDYVEARLGTDPFREDTDGDGLTDAEEVTGWEFVYEVDPDGNQLKTWVTSDPLSADGDNDGWTDFQEKVYGLHPRVRSVASLLSLDAQVDEAQAPRLLLRFEDDAETATFADSSGYNNVGTCTGPRCPTIADGRYVRGVDLDGADDAAHTTLKLDQGAEGPGATVMAWVYPRGSKTTNQQVISTNDGNRDWSLLRQGGTWSVFVGGNVERSGGSVSQDQWQHVAAVFDPASGTKLFKNGSQVASWTDLHHNPQNGTVTVGATPGGGACFNGRIDEVAVFDRALSAAEIEAAMAGLYNPQDLIVAPGDTLAYQAAVKNELLGRQAEGLLKTEFPSSLSDSTIDPTTFVLLPQEEATMAGKVDVAAAAPSGTVSMTQVAGAIIADWREQCGFAELWLPLNESGSSFTDYCGGLPPRGAECAGTHCPDGEAPGYFDYGISFDGNDDYLTLLQGGEPASAGDIGLRPDDQRQGSFSVSVWVKGTGGDFASGDRTVLGTDQQTANRGLMLGVRDGKPQMAFYGNGLNSGYSLSTGRWYHLVFRYDAPQQEMAIFVNGEPTAVEGGHAAFQGDGTLHVGRAQGGSYFQGTMDDLRIFGRALTTAEVRVLYGQPALEMHFDDAAPYDDVSGFGNAVSGPFCPVAQPRGVTGNALGFPSTGSQYCELEGTTLPNMDLTNGAFTWAMWLYPSGSDHFPQGIVGKYLGFGDTGQENTGQARHSYPSLLRVGRRLRLGFGGDTDGDGESDRWMSVETGNVLAQDAWNHVVVSLGPVYDENGQFIQNRVTFFVNGERVKSEGVGDVAVQYSDAANQSIRLGRVSHKAQVYLDRLHVVEEGDGAGKAEVYLLWNDERVCEGTNEPSKGGGCRHDGLDEGDEREIDVTLNVFENGKFEVWEQDSANVAVDGGPDCILDDELINHTFSTNAASADSSFYGSGGGCGAYGSTDVWLYYTYSNPSIPFSGRIDDLYLYKRALSLEEAQELYLSTFALLRLRLDEAPGSDNFENAVDLSGQNNAFCIRGTGGDACPTSGVSGRENQAALFDGVDDALNTELRLDQTSDGGGATLMAWVRPRSTSGGNHYVISTNDGNMDWSLLRTGGEWRVLVGGGNDHVAGIVDVDQWQHLAVVFHPADGTKLFKNGALVNSWADIGHNPNNGTVTIGANPGGNSFFDGRIDDVRVFDHAIRDADVQMIYESAPLLQLHLDEPKGATAFADASDHGNDGTCTACPDSGHQGQVGLAARFGAGELIRVPDDPGLRLTSFSIGAWVKPEAVLNDQQNVIDKTENYELALAGGALTPTLRTATSDASRNWRTVESDVALSLDTWSHVMGTYDDGSKELRIYVNGYLQGSRTLESGFTPWTDLYDDADPLEVGEGFAGDIDEAVVYGRALTPFEVRDIFHYQGKWVEDRESTAVTVDDAAPQSSLLSYDAAYPYRANQDVIMHVEAQDETSGVAMAEVCACYGDTAGCCTDEANWAAAAPCQDGGDTAWCPTFDPTGMSGEGTYTLQTRATDRVGHRESPSTSYTVHVDGTPPAVDTDVGEGALVAAYRHATQADAWTVSLSGTIVDPDLAGGAPGSGLDPDTFRVALVTPGGAVAGAETQPTRQGGTWSVDYVLSGPSPTGAYTLRVEAADQMGNGQTVDLVTFQVDATPSSASLDAGGLPTLLDRSVSLEGLGSELPTLPRAEVTLHFEEEAGATTFHDSSGWGRDATCSGAACPSVIDGKYGRALEFDGVEQYIGLGDFQVTGTIGIAAWVQPATKDGFQNIVVHGGSLSPARRVFLQIAEGEYQVGSYDGTPHRAVLAVPDEDLGRWVHLAGTYDGTHWRLYRNGVQVDVQASLVGAVTVDAEWAVGARSDGTQQFFEGSIDEVLVLGRALSLDEVRALAQGVTSGVDRVETAFSPVLPGSAFYNQQASVGTVLHLPLNDGWDEENRLSFSDISGQGNHGTCDGSHCPLSGQEGHMGRAAQFDGSEDAVSVQSFGAFTTTTISAWVNRDSGGTGGEIVSYKSDDGCGFLLDLYPRDQSSPAQPEFWVKAGGLWRTAQHTATVPAKVWVHLAGTYDGQTARLYRDGEQVASVAVPGGMEQCAGETRIGQGMEGRLDDVRTWDRALSATEIRALYLGSSPLITLPFDDPWAVDGTTLQDTSGWGHQATLHTAQTTMDQANKLVPGKVGVHALSFDGIDDYLSVAPHAALDLSPGPFTVGLWVYPERSNTEDPVLSSAAYSRKGEFYPFMNVEGEQLWYGYGDGSSLRALGTGSTSPVIPGTWNHLALSYSGSKLTAYVNGVETGWMYDVPSPYPTTRFDVGRGIDPGAEWGVPECATITNLRLTPHVFDRRYRLRINNQVVFESDDYPTPNELILPGVDSDFCTAATITLERYEWYVDGWRTMRAYGNKPDTWPRTDRRAQFYGDGRYVELYYDVTNQHPRMRYFKGRIDDVRVYPRALGGAEITALYRSGWEPATMPGDSDLSQLPWSASVPAGLEGAYRLDLRGQDAAGLVSDPKRSAWSGDVDTLAPRASLTTRTVGDQVRYVATAEDFNLAEDRFFSPCGSGATAEPTYFTPDWYRSLTAGNGEGGTERLYRLQATCLVSESMASTHVGGYDTPGRAVDVAVHEVAAQSNSGEAYAYVADQLGGLQIVDVSVVTGTRAAGHLDIPGYSLAVAVQAQDVIPGGQAAAASAPTAAAGAARESVSAVTTLSAFPLPDSLAGSGYSPTVLPSWGATPADEEPGEKGTDAAALKDVATVRELRDLLSGPPSRALLPSDGDRTGGSKRPASTASDSPLRPALLGLSPTGFAAAGFEQCRLNNTYSPAVVAVDTFSVTGTSPAGNGMEVARDAVISVTFGQSVSQTTVTTRTFRVAGEQTGDYAGTYTFGSVDFDGAPDYKPGEVVVVSLSDGIRSTDGKTLMPYAWQFRATVDGGTAAFAQGQLLDSGQSRSWPTAAALGDLDGDGDSDAFIGERDQASTVWINQGGVQGGTEGVYSDSGQRLVITGTTAIALGDVDGDGALDAVVGCEGSNPSQAWLNDGDGNFSDSGQVLGTRDTLAVALGDVNGDGSLDIFLGNDGYPAQPNEVWLNDGTGSFTESGQSLGTAWTRAVALGDLDGDGDLDAVVGNYDGLSQIWLNQGGAQGGMLGTFSLSDHTLGESGSSMADIDVGDVDGDGDLDILIAVSDYDQPSTVWLNDGAAAFTYTVSQTLSISSIFAAALGDLDGDGDLDAYLANYQEPNTVWLNDGQGGFSDSGQRLGSEEFSSDVAMGDVDGDGDLDALVVSPAEDNVEHTRLWINGGAARDDQFSVELDGRGHPLPVQANDVRAGAEPLTLTAVTTPTRGTVAISEEMAVYTPTGAYSSTDTFAYTVEDASGRESSANVVVRVGLDNAAPSARDDMVSVDEDTVGLLQPLGNDGDADGDTPFLAALGQPSHGTVSHVGNVLVYTPSADYNVDVAGPDVFTYTINDGVLADSATMSVTVLPVNDRPTFLAGPDQIIDEDAGVHVVRDWATDISPGPADETGQTVYFTTHSDDGDLFESQPAIDPTGTLSFTTKADANGTAEVWAWLHDDGGTERGGEDTSVAQSFHITVTNVDHPPTIDPIADRTLPEDAGDQVVALTGISAGPGEDQTVTVTAVSTDTTLIPDPVVSYTSPDATGSLSFSPTADRYGRATIEVTVGDGSYNTTESFVVTVEPVNDPPTLNPIPDVTTWAGAGEQTVELGGIAAGPYESQTLSISAVSTDTAVVAHPSVDYVSPAESGTLRFTPSTQAGVAGIEVTVSDGQSQIARSFQVTVQEPEMGTFAYVANEIYGLRAVDVTDPGAPSLADTYAFAGGTAYDVAIAGTLAYVAQGPAGMDVVDISDPESPSQLGRAVDLAGPALGVAVSGTYAYVAVDQGGLQVVDVSNSDHPVAVARIDTPGSAEDVAISGTYAYVADVDGGLRVIDVSEPTSPSEVGHWRPARPKATGEYARQVVVAGDYAYVANWYGGLQIIDISTPSDPQPRGSCYGSEPGLTRVATGVSVAGSRAYLVGTGGFAVIDVSDPDVPTVEGARSGWFSGYLYSVAVSGDYAYVGDGTGVQVIHVSSELAITLEGRLNADAGRGLAVSPTGETLYAAASSKGLLIADLTDLAQPVKRGAYALPLGRAKDVAVSGRYAYVAAFEQGLQIVDVRDPWDLKLAGGYEPGGWAVAVGLTNVGGTNYALLALGNAGVDVVDISDPLAPDAVATLDTDGTPDEVAVLHGLDSSDPTYALVLTGWYLEVFDISDLPASPTRIASVLLPQHSSGVVASSPGTAPPFALVGSGQAGLVKVDLSDPHNPSIWRVFDSEDAVLDADVVSHSPRLGQFGFAAASYAGLEILDLDAPTDRLRACDTAGNCTVVAAPVSASADGQGSYPVHADRAAALAETASLAVALGGVPSLLDATDAISVTGWASGEASPLVSLTVTVDGGLLYEQDWSGEGLTETLWSTSWTPSEGQHVIEAIVADASGTRAQDALTVTVDTMPPRISVAPTTITGTRYHEPRTIHVSGLVTDTGGVASVQVGAGRPGETFDLSSLATLDGSAPFIAGGWQAGWYLGAGSLPDNVDYLVSAEATDQAGHRTRVTETVAVDVVPPAAVDLSMRSDGQALSPFETVTETGEALTLEWTASSDGSGLDDYLVNWTTQTSTTAHLRAAQTASLSATYAPSDGQKVSVDLGCVDVHGQQTWQSFGPIYVDGPRTPDYVPLEGGDTYRGWMGSGCSLVGTDRRAARSAGSPEQRLYATWSASALRLAWTGANWSQDGDLFVYLDTKASVTGEPFHPHPATGASVSLPGSMAADTLVWVRDEEHALLLTWDVVSDTWAYQTALGPSSYLFRAGLNGGQTDLYLPFSLLGIDDPDSTALNLVAFASEEDALQVWAALPNANAVSSPRVIQTETSVGEDPELVLTHQYHWDGLGAGICPNGSDAPATARAFLDTDLRATLTVDPPGTAFSLLGDDLFWLRDLLVSAPADATSHLDSISTAHSPVGDGDEITYTLTVRNRGTDTAYDVSAALTSRYALTLPVAGEILLGDVGPGEREARTFHGIIDARLTEEPWAAAQVKVFDAGHPQTGEPVEWLWAHHRVDSSPPAFFGIQRPRYHIAAGQNTLSGYAFDVSGIGEVSGRTSGEGAQLFTCTGSQISWSQWACAWDASGASHGDVFAVELRAADGLGQPSGWSQAQTFRVDAQAPVLTLDATASGVSDGKLVRGGFTLVGDASDSGGVAGVEVCVEGSCGTADLALSGGQGAASYEGVPASPVALDDTTDCGGGEVTQVFAVTEDFVIDHVRVGFNAAHAHRDDLLVTLESPSGSTVTLLTDDGVSGTSFRNYNVLLHDAARMSYAAAEDDPDAPVYQRLARPAEPLRAFQGEESRGEWTLRICDLNPSEDEGVYNRSRLTLYPRDTAAKSGRWSYDVPIANGLDYVSRTIGIYAEDALGNRTSNPLSLTVWVDNVAPVITVTEALSEVLAYSSETVLRGTTIDGGEVGSVLVSLQTPAGTTRRDPATRHSDPWDYVLDAQTPGTYKLWAVARDRAGNTGSVGPFEVDAGCTAADLSAEVLSLEPAAASPFSVTVNGVISNSGSSAVDAGLPVGVYVNGARIATVTAARLEAHSSERFSIDWSVTAPGVYEVSIVPNDNAAIPLCTAAAADNWTAVVEDVPLYGAWNLVSSSVWPFAGDVDVVQRTIAGQYAVILGFEGGARSYYPELPLGLNTLQTVDGLHGYWIKVLEGQSSLHAQAPQEEKPEELPSVATLRLVGEDLPADHPIQLEAGWNLVSYLPKEMLTVAAALQSIDGFYAAVLGFEPEEGALSYYPDLDPGYNTLQTLKPGYGYWIKMVQPGILQYPTYPSGLTSLRGVPSAAGASDGDGMGVEPDQVLRDVSSTNTWVNFYGAARDSDGEPLPVGAVVVAVDPDGVVCGAVPVMVEGQYGLLPCYGDDATTSKDEGAEGGDVIRLLVDGAVVGQGTWTAHGERARVDLGVEPEPFGIYLPLILRVEGPEGTGTSSEPDTVEAEEAGGPRYTPWPSPVASPPPTTGSSGIPGATGTPRASPLQTPTPLAEEFTR